MDTLPSNDQIIKQWSERWCDMQRRCVTTQHIEAAQLFAEMCVAFRAAHEPGLPHGVPLDRAIWICSVCNGWNHVRDKFCTNTHAANAEGGAPVNMLVADSAQPPPDVRSMRVLLEDAERIVSDFARNNPRWKDTTGLTQDPWGAHAWLERYSGLTKGDGQ